MAKEKVVYVAFCSRARDLLSELNPNATVINLAGGPVVSHTGSEPSHEQIVASVRRAFNAPDADVIVFGVENWEYQDLPAVDSVDTLSRFIQSDLINIRSAASGALGVPYDKLADFSEIWFGTGSSYSVQTGIMVLILTMAGPPEIMEGRKAQWLVSAQQKRTSLLDQVRQQGVGQSPISSMLGSASTTRSQPKSLSLPPLDGGQAQPVEYPAGRQPKSLRLPLLRIAGIVVLAAILIVLVSRWLAPSPASIGVPLAEREAEVTITVDDSCSLIDALEAARTGTAQRGCPAGGQHTEIVLSEAVYRLTEANNDAGEDPNALPVIVTPVTIRGLDTRTEITGDNSGYRAFEVIESGSLTLDSVQISGFNAPGGSVCGGAIRNAGTLVVRNSVFQGNSAQGGSRGASFGGAICNDHGRVELVDTEIRYGHSDYGDGIYNIDGTVTLTGCLIEDSIYSLHGTITVLEGNTLGNVIER